MGKKRNLLYFSSLLGNLCWSNFNAGNSKYFRFNGRKFLYHALPCINPKVFKKIVDGIGPQLLTIEDLAVDFLICLLSLVFSFEDFSLELIFWGLMLFNDSLIASKTVRWCLNLRPRFLYNKWYVVFVSYLNFKGV